MAVVFEFHVAGGQVITAEYSDDYADDLLSHWHRHRLTFGDDMTVEQKREAVLIGGISEALKTEATFSLEAADGLWLIPARSVLAVLLRREVSAGRIGFSSLIPSERPEQGS